MFDIVENYNANSREFTKMLQINNNLIEKLNSKFAVNSKTNSNKALSGGSRLKEDLNQLNIMKESILKILEEYKTNTYDTAELTKKVENIKIAIKAIIGYINTLHSLVPTQNNLAILQTQLIQINEIISKY
jgi:hypothetical protein